eukprot:Skav235111  [mRNA]  locus=scaffold711:294422:295438:+ [translate_table: standard]
MLALYTYLKVFYAYVGVLKLKLIVSASGCWYQPVKHIEVWTMVAGGGASVVYSDTVADYGWGNELANYGEYSGAPTTEDGWLGNSAGHCKLYECVEKSVAQETFTYAKTILSLMCRYKHPEGKFLIIGGGLLLRWQRCTPTADHRLSWHSSTTMESLITVTLVPGIANFTDVAATFTGLIKAPKKQPVIREELSSGAAST